jgi:hypothetical protein
VCFKQKNNRFAIQNSQSKFKGIIMTENTKEFWKLTRIESLRELCVELVEKNNKESKRAFKEGNSQMGNWYEGKAMAYANCARWIAGRLA